jgi:hypothetical protein
MAFGTQNVFLKTDADRRIGSQSEEASFRRDPKAMSRASEKAVSQSN